MLIFKINLIIENLLMDWKVLIKRILKNFGLRFIELGGFIENVLDVYYLVIN